MPAFIDEIKVFAEYLAKSHSFLCGLAGVGHTGVHNLLALVCSLKKALWTGIRLSLQGRL